MIKLDRRKLFIGFIFLLITCLLFSYWVIHKILVIAFLILLSIFYNETRDKFTGCILLLSLLFFLTNMTFDKSQSRFFFPLIGERVKLTGVACIKVSKKSDNKRPRLSLWFKDINCVLRGKDDRFKQIIKTRNELVFKVVRVSYVNGLSLIAAPYVKTQYGEVSISPAFSHGGVEDVDTGQRLTHIDFFNSYVYKITTLLIPRFPIW